MLSSAPEVVRCLVTYTDWMQPSTRSFLPAPGGRSKHYGDGLRPGLVDSIDERSELCRRMQHLDERDRRILFLWYVEQRPVDEIAHAVKISRRQCFRRRSKAIETVVEMGGSHAAA